MITSARNIYRLAAATIASIVTLSLIGCANNTTTSVQSNNAQPMEANRVTTSSQPVHVGTTLPDTHHVNAVAHAKPANPLGFAVPILEYHDITYIKNDPYAMSPTQFASEMDFLKEHGFHTVTLDQVYAAMTEHAKLPRRPVVITFDDGYESNYTAAYPVLKRDGFVATEFVISGFINRKGYLTAQELLEMQNSGVFEIESHTVDHPHLSKLSSAQLWREVAQSKETLSKDFGRPVLFFCYPYGDFNNRVIHAVKQAGYLMATTTNQGYADPFVDGPYRLRRIAIHQGLSLNRFGALLHPSLSTSSV
jgi:peptidoglycan/xylan/chitin deacetylase (PgdA/CDA1 family)